jgi:hypothetical protein
VGIILISYPSTLIYVLPNMKYLILCSVKLLSVENELDQIFKNSQNVETLLIYTSQFAGDYKMRATKMYMNEIMKNYPVNYFE